MYIGVDCRAGEELKLMLAALSTYRPWVIFSNEKVYSLRKACSETVGWPQSEDNCILDLQGFSSIVIYSLLVLVPRNMPLLGIPRSLLPLHKLQRFEKVKTFTGKYHEIV
jgi:hypothetical protein